MQRCKTCGLVLPDDARICGRCGQAVVIGSTLLGTLVGQVQPPMPNVPIVQGTPQVGGVPSVQGTTTTLPGQGTSIQFTTHLTSSPGLSVHAPAPQPSYPPTPYYHWHRNQRPKVPTARWLTITVASAVVIAGIFGGLAFLLPPIISLSNSVVRQGDTMHLRGSGFIPGGSVDLILDDRQPLFVVDHGMPGESFSNTGNVLLAAAQAASPNRTVHVGLNGTFEVGIVVSQNWPLGTHTIRAMESISVRSSEVSFTIVALPGKLSVTPLGLDFGMLQQGSTATQILTISNTGEQPFDWTVNVGNASWLSLDSSSGTLQPGTFQTVHLTADASKLSVGKYSGTLMISVGSESMQVGVLLTVAPTLVPTPTPTPTPKSVPGTVPPTQPSIGQPSPTSPPAPPPPPKPTPTPSPTPTKPALPPHNPGGNGGGGGGGGGGG